jgi:aspartate/methionine/tyrosine aminotransferase
MLIQIIRMTLDALGMKTVWLPTTDTDFTPSVERSRKLRVITNKPTTICLVTPNNPVSALVIYIVFLILMV